MKINYLKITLYALLALGTNTAIAQAQQSIHKSTEYHVSMLGNDAQEGSSARPFRTISEAAKAAMPGDVITVHEGTYRERIAPPRGGTSDKQRITYQAAPGERVVITGSEPVKGWKKVQNNTWSLTLPNSFFDKYPNPFDEQIYGSWYRGKGRPNHTAGLFMNGKRIRETFSLPEVLAPVSEQPHWYAQADGNGGEVLMNFEWIRPAGGREMNSMQASVEGGDQAVCISILHRWPFGYLKDGSILHFDQVDFGQGTDTLFFQAATLAKGGVVEMHLDHADGELLGTTMVTNTGDWEQFEAFSMKMNRRLVGKSNLCFVLRAPALKVNGKTTLWAQFPQGVDPNQEAVEVTVRPQVFYPDRAGIHYITLRGFILENTATNWAPPSAEQPGLVGTRWGKGWMIEHNTIRNSRCSGIALGRSTFGHAHHYQSLPPRVYAQGGGGQTEKQLLDYFENASWEKEETGFHTVRNNHIYECGQAGIVGCSGGAFSLIEGNEIHDVCIDETFEGDEMAGIKLHFANDAIIRNNHIYRCIRGLWLDWGGQGMQVTGNLFHDNDQQEDLFIEVCHGPILVANNLMLSRNSFIPAQGVAMAHNLFSGRMSGGIDRCANGRLSYFYQPHGTVSIGKVLNEGGDWQWYNNLFVNGASLVNWDAPRLPRKYAGNVYTQGVKPDAEDTDGLCDAPFDPNIRLVQKADGWYLSMEVSPDWQKGVKRKLVTTELLDKAIIPNQPFINPDGTPMKVNTDYFGRKRKASNPFPGPIEVKRAGKQEWKVWPSAL